MPSAVEGCVALPGPLKTESTVWPRDSVIITTYKDQENNIFHQIEEPILTDN